MYDSQKALLSLGFGLLAPVIGVAEQGHAGDSEGPIEQIIVVANKHEQSIRDVAANVTVLADGEFGLEMAASMSDVLRYAPGIDAEGAGTRFGSEGINIRGIGGNRVAVLIDGVPLGDQFDVGNFSNATRDFVDAGFIRRAEILHGPASAIYGSSAIGGVVALRTPDPFEFAGTGLSGGALATAWRGTDSSLHATGLQSIAGDRVGALLGISVRDGEETDSAAADANLDTRDYRRRSAIVKLAGDDARANTWKLGYYAQESDVTSSLSSMLGSGRFRSTTALEGDDSYRMDLLSAEYGFGDGSGWFGDGVLRGYYGVTDIRQKTLDERGQAQRPVSIDRLFGFEQQSRGLELNLQKELAGRRASHRIGIGVDYRRRRTEEFRDGLETGLEDGLLTNILLGEVFPLRDFPISKSTDWGVYVEDSIAIGQWTIVGGLRADRYELDPVNDSMYAEDYPSVPPVSLSDSEASPKLGLVYRPNARVDLYLQYARGFRAPPYEDANIGLELPLFNVRAIPNPELRSETSDGIDVGLRWVGDTAGAHVSIFRTRYEDFIESKVRLGPDPVSGRILFQSQNLSRATIEGIEAGWNAALATKAGELLLDASVYWARGENRDNGEPLNSVGPAQAVIGIDWAPVSGRWHARLRSTFTAGWTDRDESGGELFTPPGHAVYDLYLLRFIGDRLRLRAGIANLSDKTYWAWSDVRGLAPEDPVIPYLARPGRSLLFGLDMHW